MAGFHRASRGWGRRAWLGAALTLAGAAGARGQGIAPWTPPRPLRLIVPFPPGGPSDLFGRLFAEALAAQIGQQVVVENRGGGGGIVGVDAVAKARPDGLTIGVTGASALVVGPSLAQPMPFSVHEDLANLSLMVRVRQAVVVGRNSPYRGLADLVADARARPELVTFASSGATSSLATALLAREASVKLTDVPYRGAAPALTDLLAGRVAATIVDLPVALGHIQSGDLRALAITSERRSPLVPDAPTATEQGLPGLATDNWYGLAAPGRTPEPILQGLHAACLAALRSPAIVEGFAIRAGEAVPMERAAYAAFLRAEDARWGPLVRASGMTGL
jgi:tripartite-type tricarboxylate transporter receptor subunit TctC